MEQERVIEVKKRLDKSLESIATLEKEAISFAESKSELIKTSEELRNLLKEVNLFTKEMTTLVQDVTKVTVDKTLRRFDENVKMIEEKVQNISKNNLELVETTELTVNSLKQDTANNILRLEKNVISLKDESEETKIIMKNYIDILNKNSNRKLLIFGIVTIIFQMILVGLILFL